MAKRKTKTDTPKRSTSGMAALAAYIPQDQGANPGAVNLLLNKNSFSPMR